MRWHVENAALQLALIGAVLLLFAPLTPRTTWTYDGPKPRGNPATIRDSAGWEWVAPLAGIVAIVALALAVVSRHRIVVPSFGAAVAAVAFAVAALAAGDSWLALSRGAAARAEFAAHPAPGPPYFTVIAITASALAVLLTVSWLVPNDHDW